MYLSVRVVAIVYVFLSVHGVASAQSKFFAEDFTHGDGDPFDQHPVEWRQTVGDALLDWDDSEGFSVSDCYSAECTIVPFRNGSPIQYTDVSIRARASLIEGVFSLVPWARWTENLDRAYYGFVRRESGLVGVGTQGFIRDSINLIDGVVEDDVVIKVDVIGNELSVAAWPADGPAAELPVASFVDSPPRIGAAGISISNRGDDVSSVSYRWIEFAEIVPGDVDTNSTIDASDIDHLSTAIREGLGNNRYDVNRDDFVNVEDRTYWVDSILGTYFGDADLNRVFDSGDLVAVFSAGEYEDALAHNSGWAEGDWDGDGDFTSGDMVMAFKDGGYDQGPRPGVNAVPEPSGIVMLAIAAVIFPLSSTRGRCRRSRKTAPSRTASPSRNGKK